MAEIKGRKIKGQVQGWKMETVDLKKRRGRIGGHQGKLKRWMMDLGEGNRRRQWNERVREANRRNILKKRQRGKKQKVVKGVSRHIDRRSQKETEEERKEWRKKKHGRKEGG